MEKLLILGFYGIGKTTYAKKHDHVIDITDFKTDDMPDINNLIKYYEDPQYDIIIADPQWTSVFIKSGYPFYIIIPKETRKEEFLQNFRSRAADGSWKGDVDTFLDVVDKCWYGWLDMLKYRIPCQGSFVLREGEWFKEGLNKILEYKKMR